jgi:hypothetical protein
MSQHSEHTSTIIYYHAPESNISKYVKLFANTANSALRQNVHE